MSGVLKTEGWRDTGSYLDILGIKIFYRDTGGDKPVLLMLHGFPTSSYDYHHVIDMLSEHFRVIVHDHPGFGLSDKPADYSYSLVEQAEVAIALWKSIGVEEGHLLGHDYGTSVSTEVIARFVQDSSPVKIKSLTLCNGSVHIQLAKLRPIQVMLRNQTFGPIVAKLASYNTFRRNMRAIWSDAGIVDEDELKEMWNQMEMNSGRERLPVISRYTLERFKFWNRWIGALEQLKIPAHILWADKDPIAIPAIAEALKKDMPHAKLTWLKGIGHYPMIEAPEQWANEVVGFFKKNYA